MNWQRWILTGALVAGLAGFGCGDDPVEVGNDDENQQNQNNDNQNNQNNDNQNNQEEDEFAEAADVWVGSDVTGEEDQPTPVPSGQTFGGRFDETTAEPVHSFAVDLPAGEVATLSIVDLESGAEAQSNQIVAAAAEYQPDAFFAPTPKLLLAEHHTEREFFVADTATHTIDVSVPGGEENGYIFEVTTEPVEVHGDLEVPGTTDGDLDDASIDVFEVNQDELTSVSMEVFAQRSPVESSLDAWLIVWDADNGQVPWDGTAQNDSQSEDVVDPLLDFDFEPDTDYYVIMDMYANHTDAAYEIETGLLDSSANNPIALGDGDEFDGRIESREAEPFFDYFTVTVDPGQFKKVTVVGDDELQPGMELNEDSDEEDMFAGADAQAYAVGDTAGATLGVGEDADDPVTFTVDVTDYRNLMQDPQDPEATFFGGDEYGYNISVEETTPEATEMESGDVASVELDTPGEIELVDVHVDDDQLLWLYGGLTTVPEVDDIADLDMVPVWAFADEHTLDAASVLHGFFWGQDQDYSVLMRDWAFRGDDEDYDTELEAYIYDAAAPDFDDNEVEMDDGNESFDDALDLSVPAHIHGEFPEPEDDGGRGFQQEPEEEADPLRYYFTIDAEEGDHIVAYTENGPNNPGILRLLDDDEELAADGTFYMEQVQEPASEQEMYYDAAVALQVEEDGEYVLEIEQYCQMGWFGMECFPGEVGVNVFIESWD